MTSDAPTPAYRNVPTQARSRERLQRLLDAAASVLADEGADALTAARIAEVAGVPVGSLYHLFVDKEGIVEALALRYWQGFEAVALQIADDDERDPLADPVGQVFAALAESFRSDPGFQALWYGGLRSQRVRDITRPIRAGFAAAFVRILTVHWPQADRAARIAAAEMVVRTGDGLLREAFRVDPQGDAALLAETTFMLSTYLEAKLGGAAR